MIGRPGRDSSYYWVDSSICALRPPLRGSVPACVPAAAYTHMSTVGVFLIKIALKSSQTKADKLVWDY